MLPKCQRTKPAPASVPKDKGYYFVRYQHCRRLVSTCDSAYSTFSWHVEPEEVGQWQLVYIDRHYVTFLGSDETGKFIKRYEVLVDIEPLSKEAWPKAIEK